MIYTITLNPAIDRTIFVDELHPADVSIVTKTIRQAAGKGINVSYVLHELDTRSIIVTILGGPHGEFIQQQLATDKIESLLVRVDGNTRENIKVVPARQQVWELNEEGPIVDTVVFDSLLGLLLPRLVPNDIVVVTGSLPRGIPRDGYRTLIEQLQQQGVITLLDASGTALYEGIKANPTIIKPNQFELEEYFDEELSTLDAIVSHAKQLQQQGIQEVLVTLGAKGSLYISANETLYAPPQAVTAINTVGAGDSFVAGYIKALSEGKPPSERLAYAAAVSIVAVLSEGTGLASAEQIDAIQQQIVIEAL